MVSSSSMAAASGVPDATAMRKLAEIQTASLVEQRALTTSCPTFYSHPSASLVDRFSQSASRVGRSARASFDTQENVEDCF